jgi:hypothetical protein
MNEKTMKAVLKRSERPGILDVPIPVPGQFSGFVQVEAVLYAVRTPTSSTVIFPGFGRKNSR